ISRVRVDDLLLAGPKHDTRPEPDIERVCHGLFRSWAASTASAQTVCGLDFFAEISEPCAAIGRHIETCWDRRPSLCRPASMNGTVGQICRSNGGPMGVCLGKIGWASRPHLVIGGSRPCAWR